MSRVVKPMGHPNIFIEDCIDFGEPLKSIDGSVQKNIRALIEYFRDQMIVSEFLE